MIIGDDMGPRLVVFDLDGTLTWRDTLASYLWGYAYRRPTRLLRLISPLLTFAFSHRDRGRLKAEAIKAVFAGDGRDEVAVYSARFVESLGPGGAYRDGALRQLRNHQAAKDTLVLLSASPDLYVPLIGKALGFDHSVCTELAWRGNQLDGTLASANRRDAEKLRCISILKQQFPDRRVIAYANSESDLVHLCAVDCGVLVNANAAIRKRAALLGLVVESWV
jgi:phosphatidylglycerophosphatase C